MDMPTMERAREETMKLAAPFQMLWKTTLFDIPLAVASESVRLYERCLRAQNVPEMIEAHSHFIRKTVATYGHETSKIMENVRGTVNEAQNQMTKAAG
jgi:hypothetical protein